ncbi:hypothetical protein B0H34DRAFT_374589 [Crassisporium funariophilum]|nr:hypothetical protein B0H34DRAFT_374589 [Crassisporium funariophilum]
MRSIALFVSALVASACAKTIVITVGGNTTDNAGAVFDPPSVVADKGDVVMFNFTQGNHTATQSTFASPCTRAHDTDSTINGFDSGFRNANNGTSITNLPFTVTDNTTTVWFFDWNTCAQGGVGGINVNESSLETLDGFQRNAVRLNGTDSTATSSSTTSSNPSTTRTSTTSTPTSAANRAIVAGATALLPVLAMLLALSF